MKIFLEEQLLEIGSAGLRCGRWARKHTSDKSVFNVGWHAGKAYAYLYTLSMVGIVEVIDKKKVLDYEDFIKNNRRGRIELFPGMFGHTLLMKKKWFNKILESKQPHQGPIVVKEIRKMCLEIL